MIRMRLLFRHSPYADLRRHNRGSRRRELAGGWHPLPQPSSRHRACYWARGARDSLGYCRLRGMMSLLRSTLQARRPARYATKRLRSRLDP